MLPMRSERFVVARRGRSIGTLRFRSQDKRVEMLGFGLVLALSISLPAPARAAGTAAAPAESAPALPPPPPSTVVPAAASEPVPPAPAPAPGPPVPAVVALPVPVAVAVAPPGTPGSDLPPPPRPPWGAKLHDGFYLRMAVGLGIAGASISSDSSSLGEYSFAGAAGALDLWIGGTPVPGLAMGGALSGLGLNSSRRTADGQAVSGDVAGGTGLLAYFVDVFPDPGRGLHFGGAIGFASAAGEVKDSGRKFAGGGLGLEAWGGYQLWVSPQWSLGGMLRLMGSVTGEDKEGVSYRGSVGGGTLSFTALYH
jgi:hypothetical protein